MIHREAWYRETSPKEDSFERDRRLILEMRRGQRDAYLKLERRKGRKALWRVFVLSPETEGRWLRRGTGATQEEAVRAAIEAGELPSTMRPTMLPVKENYLAPGRDVKADERRIERLKTEAQRGDRSAFEQLVREYSRLDKRLPILDIPWDWYKGFEYQLPLYVIQIATEEWVYWRDEESGEYSEDPARELTADTRPTGYTERLDTIVTKLREFKRSSHASSDGFTIPDILDTPAWMFWRPVHALRDSYVEDYTEFSVPDLSKQELEILAKSVNA